MSTEERGGAVRLLEREDLGRSNHFGKPLVGWAEANGTAVALGSLCNPMGFAMIRVVVQKWLGAAMVDLYDQPVIVENPGAVVVCLVGSGVDHKVGLIRAWRNTGERVNNETKTYVAGINERGEWAQLLATLGRWEWELPRGLAPGADDLPLDASILRLAKTEALEEAGLVLGPVRMAGRLNWNTTFCAHAQYVVVGQVIDTVAARPEELEILGQLRLFGLQELRVMVGAGELTDGLGLAALAIAGFHF